jgi:hypothetical protein
VGVKDETAMATITTMEMGIAATMPRAKAKGKRGSQVQTRMNANRSIRARRMDETRAMDCDNNHNHNIDASRPRPAHGEKGRINHTVVRGSMRRRLRHHMHTRHGETTGKDVIALG